MLYLPDLTSQASATPDRDNKKMIDVTTESKMQSVIPYHLREIQQEGEIIDFDDQNWCKKFNIEAV